MTMKKFSDLLAENLLRLGYSHCYFVAGGNIMHLLNYKSCQITNSATRGREEKTLS